MEKRWILIFMRHKNLSVLFLLSIIINSLHADIYQLNVTRKSKNFYGITGKDAFIQTKYCYEYAYSEDAILNTNGYPELIFTDSTQKCDVKGLYSLANPKTGTFKVNVSQEEDDWYSIMGVNDYIKTSMCLELSLGNNAILKVNSSGYGKLIFDNGRSCSVEGIYSKIRL